MVSHRPSTQKLHRIPTGVAESDGLLKELRNDSFLAEGFPKLYMEAYRFKEKQWPVVTLSFCSFAGRCGFIHFIHSRTFRM